MNFTRIGLKIRATVQGRETAESLGVNTRRDRRLYLRARGRPGGVAGYALTSIAGVTPDMGQNYIVDSFLVVVTGGVGKLAGSVWAGLGIGTLNQLLEPTHVRRGALGGRSGRAPSYPGSTSTIRAFRAGPKAGAG